MKKLMQEFRDFAMRGNVMDLAVGVIIGGAFQAIVQSLTQDIISPVLGLFGKQDFSGLVLNVLGVSIGYGAFLTAVINFLIMAIVIFILVKALNRLSSLGHHDAAPAAPATKPCPFCCTEIALAATRCPHCTSLLETAES